jgi:diaminopimelate epimerase
MRKMPGTMVETGGALLMKVTMERYHGLGNDYLVYDPNKNELQLNKENAAMLCNRNMGLGSDGILEGPFIGESHMSLRIWNPDGSIAEKSGNGVRIFAKYLKDAGYVQKKNYKLVTDGGLVEITYLNEDGSRLRVSMGKLSFWSDEIPVTGERREVINEDMVFGRTLYPVTCISVGNPHCVIPMREISKPLVCKIGNYSEVARYFPERINTEIMKVVDDSHIEIETFERGAGYTMATGTGACAAAGVAYKLGLTGNKIIVHMPGGDLQVEIDEDWNVYMTGEVFYVAKITLSSEFSEKLRTL